MSGLWLPFASRRAQGVGVSMRKWSRVSERSWTDSGSLIQYYLE